MVCRFVETEQFDERAKSNLCATSLQAGVYTLENFHIYYASAGLSLRRFPNVVFERLAFQDVH